MTALDVSQKKFDRLMGMMFDSIVSGLREPGISKDGLNVKMEFDTHAYDDLLSYLYEKGLLKSMDAANKRFVASNQLISLILASKWKNLGSDAVLELNRLMGGMLNPTIISYLDNLDDFYGRIRSSLGIRDFSSARGRNKIGMEGMGVLLAMDDNYFKTIFTGETTLLNFKDKQVAFEGDNERPEETIRSCLGFMLRGDTKVFHCAGHITEMLLMTDNKIHDRKLPFSSIFIDANLEFRNIRFFGLLLTAVNKAGDHLSFAAEQGVEPDGFLVFSMGMDINDSGMVYNFVTVLTDGLYKTTKKDKSLKFLSTFACNFLDFLHDPSVQYVKASNSYGSAHRHLRRLYESRRIDLDKTYFVRISDPLKRYVDRYIHLRTMRGYSHRFWVRGHFRTLHAERYGERIGQRIWIAPFIKGAGVLLDKQYSVDEGGAVPQNRVVSSKDGFPKERV